MTLQNKKSLTQTLLIFAALFIYLLFIFPKEALVLTGQIDWISLATLLFVISLTALSIYRVFNEQVGKTINLITKLLVYSLVAVFAANFYDTITFYHWWRPSIFLNIYKLVELWPFIIMLLILNLDRIFLFFKASPNN